MVSMNYKETRGKIFNRAYIARQRSKKTRWGIERGNVFTMCHLWRWSFGTRAQEQPPRIQLVIV
jgi:hypothetical protein